MNGSGARGWCWSLALRRFLSRQRTWWAAHRQKQKQKSRCERAGDVLPSHTGLRCDGPSGRYAGLPLDSSSVVFCCGLCCECNCRDAAPADSGGGESQAVAHATLEVYCAVWVTQENCAVCVVFAGSTPGGCRLLPFPDSWRQPLPVDQTSAKKLANFTPAPLALMPTEPAAAITLSLTCTSSSRRKYSESWLPRR